MRRIEASVEMERQAFERRECENALNNAEQTLRDLSRSDEDSEDLADMLHTLTLWAEAVPRKYRTRAEELIDRYGN